MLKLENVEIEDQVVLGAVMSAFEENVKDKSTLKLLSDLVRGKKVLSEVKEALFSGLEMLDTRNDYERARVE